MTVERRIREVIDRVVGDGETSIGQALRDTFPECRTGDVPPGGDARLREALGEFVGTWYEDNAPAELALSHEQVQAASREANRTSDSLNGDRPESVRMWIPGFDELTSELGAAPIDANDGNGPYAVLEVTFPDGWRERCVIGCDGTVVPESRRAYTI
jgi:hypothetical protein